VSLGSLLRHDVTIVRDTAVLDGNGDPTYTELGHPVSTPVPSAATWRCLIQPRTSREIAILTEAGGTVSDHVVFGYPPGPRAADRLVCTDGRQFEVVGDPADAGGQARHLEVPVRRIVDADTALPTG
jgi:hypothetical protein